MKLSNETVSVLKNFATISTGIYVPAGSKLRVKESKNRVLAEAKVAEKFPAFCVADLGKFLSVLTSDKDVEIDFDGSDVVFTTFGGKSKINYRGSPKNLVNVPKDSELTIENPEVEFKLSADTLAYIWKVVGLLGLPNVAFESINKVVCVKVFDPKNDGENTQVLTLDTKTKKNFQIIFDQEVLRFVEGDYTVTLSNGISKFQHDKLDLVYWVAPELGSTYSE
jgi:hypothetical protein